MLRLLKQRHPKGNFQQLEVGSVWQTLTLDLLLGNAEQSFWEWADPHSIFLLIIG